MRRAGIRTMLPPPGRRKRREGASWDRAEARDPARRTRRPTWCGISTPRCRSSSRSSFEVAEARLEDCWYRGETISAVLRLAACRAGPVEVEAVEVVPGPAPHREQLGSRGPGLHHVRFRVEDLGEAEGRAGRMGFRVVFRRRFGPAVAFCCLELPEPPGPTWVELLELPRPEPSPR